MSVMELVERRCGVANEAQVQYDNLFFDLDDTLYPFSSGIAAACRKNIEEYMTEKLGIESAIVSDLCGELYRNHGTSLAGLVERGYNIDFDDFHSYVHGRLPYHVLRPDPLLRNILLSMPQRKWIYTNADEKHAHKCLKRLGLEDCFESIICFETFNVNYPNLNTWKATCHDFADQNGYSPIVNFTKPAKMSVICKPSREAMSHAIKLAGVDPSKTLFFDDSARNIAGGKAAGLHTVLVGSSTRVEGADYTIESIHNIREAIPGIWQEQEVIFSSSTVPMEAIVVAA